MHSAGLARRPYSAADAAAIMTGLTIGSIIASRGAEAAATRKRLPAAEPKAGSGSDLRAYRPVAAGRSVAVKLLTILALAAAAAARGARAVQRAEP